MKVRPLGDRALLLRLPPPVKKAGSRLYTPESATKMPQEGVVLAVGDGDGEHPMKLKVNDVVLFAQHSGAEVEIAHLTSEPLFMLRVDEALAVVDDPDPALADRVKTALDAYQARERERLEAYNTALVEAIGS